MSYNKKPETNEALANKLRNTIFRRALAKVSREELTEQIIFNGGVHFASNVIVQEYADALIKERERNRVNSKMIAELRHELEEATSSGSLAEFIYANSPDILKIVVGRTGYVINADGEEALEVAANAFKVLNETEADVGSRDELLTVLQNFISTNIAANVEVQSPHDEDDAIVNFIASLLTGEGDEAADQTCDCPDCVAERTANEKTVIETAADRLGYTVRESVALGAYDSESFAEAAVAASQAINGRLQDGEFLAFAVTVNIPYDAIAYAAEAPSSPELLNAAVEASRLVASFELQPETEEVGTMTLVFPSSSHVSSFAQITKDQDVGPEVIAAVLLTLGAHSSKSSIDWDSLATGAYRGHTSLKLN